MTKAWKDVKDSKTAADFLKEVHLLPETDKRTAVETKVKGVKKWPITGDAGAASAMEKLWTAAATAKASAAEVSEISVTLKSYSKPKFAHNGFAAGKAPSWVFTYTAPGAKKPGEVTITMNEKMKDKNENDQKKHMSDSAIAAIKEEYPKATVKMKSGTLDS